jgi:hypothetical protein
MERKRRRPRLTRKVIVGLQSVYHDAWYALDERVGCNQEPGGEKSLEYDGLEYLEALIIWYDATHPKPTKR